MPGFSAGFLTMIAAFCWTAAALAGPVVHIGNGAIEGAVKAPGVESFLGIPFAAPPVGALRWRAPRPAAAWAGTLEATSFSKDCIQEPEADPPGPGFNNPASEDCLYLNVWRPIHHAARLPVMVWIYGGAYIMGAGSFPSYDGTAFARAGVILVTFNYRLGRFGVFAHPELSREQAGQPVANYGLMDQIATLRWVKANIAAFGGDPGNVTIFGESAGAGSVDFLMVSPLARGLFAKAIAESGGSDATLRPLADAEAAGKAWADKMGAATLARLRALPADRVWDGPVTEPAFPVQDGKLVVAPTARAFADGLAAPVPYLEGFNSREESLLRWLPGVDERWFAGLGEKGPALLALYSAEGRERGPALAQLWGEASMAAPARARARDVAEHGGTAWLYRYAYVPDAAEGKANGAGHDAEMEMVFKNPDMRWSGHWSRADAGMARTVNAYWVNFARTGDPNGAGLPRWPAYTAANDTLMGFGQDGPRTITGFGKGRLDAIDAAGADAL